MEDKNGNIYTTTGFYVIFFFGIQFTKKIVETQHFHGILKSPLSRRDNFRSIYGRLKLSSFDLVLCGLQFFLAVETLFIAILTSLAIQTVIIVTK